MFEEKEFDNTKDKNLIDQKKVSSLPCELNPILNSNCISLIPQKEIVIKIQLTDIKDMEINIGIIYFMYLRTKEFKI